MALNVVSGDFDDNGKLDLASINSAIGSSDDTVTVLLNRPATPPPPCPPAPPGPVNVPHRHSP
jgi:hypothetical protein